MSGKPKLHYFNGRGRMESIRWLLAAAGVEFDECFLETRDDLLKLQESGALLFQQVPMVEIDGMKLVQTRAIGSYIAAKYNLYGKDLKERALIDMYVEALTDLDELLMHYAFQPADKKEQYLANTVDKATNRYFPVFEKVLKDHGQDFLVWRPLLEKEKCKEQRKSQLFRGILQSSFISGHAVPSLQPSRARAPGTLATSRRLGTVALRPARAGAGTAPSPLPRSRNAPER
nr:PREDICTED: glutathione S-transferase-like [Struthio camelus australis]